MRVKSPYSGALFPGSSPGGASKLLSMVIDVMHLLQVPNLENEANGVLVITTLLFFDQR